MCLPAAAALTMGGSLISGMGSIMGGNADADAEKYNIGIMENDIRQVTAKAEEEKQTLAMESLQQLGQGRTSLAAGNVAIGTGTAADWEIDVGKALEADTSTVDRSLSRRVSSIRMSQSLAEQRAKAAKTAGYFGAGSSLISGASRVALGFAS